MNFARYRRIAGRIDAARFLRLVSLHDIIPRSNVWVDLALAAATGIAVHLAIGTTWFPIAGLLAPVPALALARGWRGRLWIALTTQFVLWLSIPSLLITYGIEPIEAVSWVALVALCHVAVLTALPPMLSVLLWMLSPFAFGHPWFGLVSLLPTMTPSVLVGISLILLCLMAFRQTLMITACAMMMLAGLQVKEPTDGSILHVLERDSVLMAAVNTDLDTRNILPSDLWETFSEAARLASLERSGPALFDQALDTLVFAEGLVATDHDRVDGVLSSLAQLLETNFIVGVSLPSGEQVMRLYSSGLFDDPQDIYVQRQGVPILNSSLASPLKLLESKPVDLVLGPTAEFMICYEAMLPTVWLSALFGRSNVVVVAANDGWGAGEAISLPRQKLFTALSRHKALLFALNGNPGGLHGL